MPKGVEDGALAARRDEQRFQPLYLGGAFVLAVAPFLMRASNPYLAYLDSHARLGIFVNAVFITVAVIAAAVFAGTLRSAGTLTSISRPRCAIISTAIAVAGVALSGPAMPLVKDALPPWITAIAGVCVGAGMSVLLLAWGELHSRMPLRSIPLNVAVVFFAASVLWALASLALTMYAQCVVLSLFLVVGTVLLLIAWRSGGNASVCSAVAEPKPQCGVESLSGNGWCLPSQKAIGEAAYSLWIPFTGIAFSFFTSGLTLRPDVAGVIGGDINYTKFVAYIVVIVLVWATCARHGDVSSDLAVTWNPVLPLAAALLLVFPFLTISNASFWGRVAGIVGQRGQLVSLCVLAAFLVLMTVFAMRRGAGRVSSSLARDVAAAQSACCEELVVQYHLFRRARPKFRLRLRVAGGRRALPRSSTYRLRQCGRTLSALTRKRVCTHARSCSISSNYSDMRQKVLLQSRAGA